MKTISLMILAATLLFGCSKKDEAIVIESEKLIGNWTNPVLVDTVWKYERVSSLKDNEYGFSFKQEKVFFERKNAGWCGTPPIVYDNYNGTWSRNNSEINISVGYWGGTAEYKWRIISLDDTYLTIYKEKEDYSLVD